MVLNISQTLFMGLWGYGRERGGVLGQLLNSHPKALKHLIPALMHFYIGLCLMQMLKRFLLIVLLEVEQTGASSQFYDKFSEFVCCSDRERFTDLSRRCEVGHIFTRPVPV